MVLLVLSDSSRREESFVAFVTFVCSLSLVTPRVSCQSSGGEEFLYALSTFERLLSADRVPFQVRFQSWGRVESLPTA